MRKTSWLALAALLVAPAAIAAQENSPQSAPAQSSQSSPASQTNSSAASQDPLAAAARKAREQQKKAPKAAVVFDNDNLPTGEGVSTVGEASAPAKSGKNETSPDVNPQGDKAAAQWQAKFADLRQKLQKDQGDLAEMQKKLSQEQLQFYNGDPQKGYQDEASGHPYGEDYDKTKAAIDTQQKKVDDDQQAISDAEDALRKAGGDPGWER